MNETLTISNANVEAMFQAARSNYNDADRVVDTVSYLIAMDKRYTSQLDFLSPTLVKESILSIHGQTTPKSVDSHPANYALELLDKAKKDKLQLSFDGQSLFCPLQFELPRR